MHAGSSMFPHHGGEKRSSFLPAQTRPLESQEKHEDNTTSCGCLFSRIIGRSIGVRLALDITSVLGHLNKIKTK